MKPPAPRSGSTLLVVFGVLALLAGLAFMYGFQGRSATLQSHRAEEGERAAGLAELALRAALHRIRAGANQPEDPLFGDFRSPAIPPARLLPLEALTGVAAELGRAGQYRLVGDGVTVQLLRKAAATRLPEEASADETLGVLRVAVKVEGPDRASAELTEEYGVRVLLTTLPRPFDMFTFFLGDPRTLLSKGAYQDEPNATLDMAASRLASLRRDLGDLARDLERAGTQANAPGLVEAARAMAQAAGPGWPARPWTVVEPVEDSTPVPDRVHRFAFPLSIYSLADRVDLAALDLPSKVGPLVAASEARKESIAAKTRQLLADAAAASPDQLDGLAEPIRALLAEVLDEARGLDRLLAAYKAFEDGTVEINGPARAKLAARARTFMAPELRWRSDFRFEGPGAAERAGAFLAGTPPPQGVVYVAAPKGERLTVNLPGFRGRLVIAAVCDLTVQAATVADPARDALVLVVHGELNLDGPLRAGLVSWASRFERRPGDLAGQLLLDDLPPGADLSSLLSGTLEGLAGLRSGPGGDQDRPPPDPKAIHVTLAPVASYRKTVP